MTSLIVLTALFIVIVLITPSRSNLLERYDELMKDRTPCSTLEDLAIFVTPQLDRSDDAQFWKASQGVVGAARRLYETGRILRLLQRHRQVHSVTREEAWWIYQRVVLQLVFSTLIPFEALVCRLTRGAPHLAARQAFSLYFELAIRTEIMCAM